eukprot:scaffold22834_cov119-Isochrysis_galbana.AAC.2
MGAASTPHAATFSSRFAEYFKPPTSPAEYLARSLKQSSISLTLGVFIGAALTTGVAFGALTAWLANEKVLRRLVKHAGVVVHHARDAVLNTREGRALARALLAAPGAPTNPSDVGDSAPQGTSPAVGLPSPATSRFDSGMGLAALREDEILPPETRELRRSPQPKRPKNAQRDARPGAPNARLLRRGHRPRLTHGV